MKKYPLILKGGQIVDFNPITTYPLIDSGVVPTGRGELVAICPITAPPFEWAPLYLDLTFSLGGVNVLESVNINEFALQNKQIESFENFLPVNYGSGQNYNLVLNPTPNNPTPPSNISYLEVLFCFDGFYLPNKTQKLKGTKKLGFNKTFAGNEVAPTVPSPVITGSIPKDRGKIVGIEITRVEESSFSTLVNSGNITFSIDGIKLIEEVSHPFFIPQNGNAKTFYFDEPFEGGGTFELLNVLTAVGNKFTLGVNFIFGDDE